MVRSAFQMEPRAWRSRYATERTANSAGSADPAGPDLLVRLLGKVTSTQAMMLASSPASLDEGVMMRAMRQQN